jgi:hypothetical protein
MKAYLVLLVMVIGCYYIAMTDSYTDDKPYAGVIVAMSNIESGGKYSHSRPTLGIHLDNGDFYDCETSVARYSQWHVGDRIVITQRDIQYHSVWYRTLLNMFATLFAGIGTLALVIIGIYCILDRKGVFE